MYFTLIINKHFNFCCFRAVAYTTLDRLSAVFLYNKQLGFVLRAIRETPHLTTGVPPALLAILKDTMNGKVELPLNLGKMPVNIWTK